MKKFLTNIFTFFYSVLFPVAIIIVLIALFSSPVLGPLISPGTSFLSPSYCILIFSVLIVAVYFWYRKASELYNDRIELAEKKRIFDQEKSLINKSLSDKDAIIKSLESKIEELQSEKDEHKQNLEKFLQSNLTSIPWLAGMIADYLTYDIEIEAKKLEWGNNVQRQKKVASLREIRRSTKEKIEEAKVAIYQLEYLKAMYPGIEDILVTDYQNLHFDSNYSDHDPVLDYVAQSEWLLLPEDERNQLALDRYIASRKKSSWQIGRDYELSVGYEYSKKGYRINTYGSYMKLEDLGRDLIAFKEETVLVIQCKYWSHSKKIHEKHILQLYGTCILYCLEHKKTFENVKPLFVTNIELSVKAKEVAKYLGVNYVENHDFVDFPRIKCNIGRDAFGLDTKIYHLPMDDQYDVTTIDKPGEFYAYTVKEAVTAGFRRAYKWHGES